MIFRSKIDRYFINFILVAIIIVAIASFFPLFIEDEVPSLAVLILTATFLIITGFMLWTSFAVKYVFHEKYLFVKGGPFRSRIPYEQITKVVPTKDIFTGYRILSSRDAIEIIYPTGMMGSVKVSPRDQQAFIAELKKRCPHVKVEV